MISQVNDFVAENLEITLDSEDFIESKTLYENFREWCTKNQRRGLTLIVFVNEIKKLDGVQQTRRRKPNTWRTTSALHGFVYCKLRGGN